MLRSALCVFLLAFTAVPAVAAAGDGGPDLPKGKLVAGPTKNGARLYAADTRRGLCLTVTTRDHSSSANCSGAPSGDLRHPLIGSTGSDTGTEAYGSVRESVAAVELVVNSGTRVKAPTTAGAYTGRYASRTRFFLADIPRVKPFVGVRYARLLDAAGNLLAVADQEFLPPRVSPITVLRRGRVAGRSWRLRAFRRQLLASVPRDEERFELNTCVDIGIPFDRNGPEACTIADLPQPDLRFEARAVCAGGRGVGLVSSRVRSVVATLGSGRTRRLPIVAVPMALGGGRAVSLAVGPNTAVRSVAARDGAGHRLAMRRIALEPGALQCRNDDGSFGIYLTNDEPEQPAVSVPRLQVRDLGARLCVTARTFSPLGSDCLLPPLDTYNSRFFVERAGGSTLVAGVVPGYITRIEAEFRDGGRESIPATFDGPYAGRYQGTVRFASKQFRGTRYAVGFRLFDAAGHKALTYPTSDSFRLIGRPRTILRGPGGLRLGLTTAEFAKNYSFLCLLKGRPRYPTSTDACDLSVDGSVEIEAPCMPRQLEITGGVSPRVRALTFLTTRGGVRAKIARFRAKDPRGRRYRAALVLAVLPRNAALRGWETTTAKGTKRHQLRLPSAASQCGWSSYTDL